MAGFKIPVFEKGMVLTHEMLELMKSYAIDLGNLSFEEYSDGIISGCNVTMSDNLLYIGRGMLMYQGMVYLLSEPIKVPLQVESKQQIVSICIGNVTRDKNYLVGEFRVEVSTEEDMHANKIEICRFKLQKGAVLRSQYKNFKDLSTEYDTVNEIYATWSAYQGNSISNRILKEFAREAQNKKIQNPIDMVFIQQILGLDGKTLNREVITFYLKSRLGRTSMEMTNKEIYDGLLEILRICEQEYNVGIARQREARRIIVD